MQADSHIGNRLKGRKLDQNSAIIEKGRPMCITNLFLNHPCKIITPALIILSLITYWCFRAEYFMLTPDNSRQFMVFSDQKTIDWDK
jgi:hypothetical protein